jgi:hypothetical protein
MTIRADPNPLETNDHEYEPPRLVQLGPVSELTLIGKDGSLSDGIHFARLGGSLHNSSA